MVNPIENLRALDSANFRTSKKADLVNDELLKKFGLTYRYEPARLAISQSLALPEPPPQIPKDDADDLGKSINGKTLFGEEDLAVWTALIVENSMINAPPTIELIQDLVKRHWHRGIFLLKESFEAFNLENKTFGEFIIFLAERAGLPLEASGDFSVKNDNKIGDLGSRSSGEIRIKIGNPGTNVDNNEAVYWTLNKSGSPHVAIMGGTGSGKTRLAIDLISQIKNIANVPVILFDFAKGDLANNSSLVSQLKANVISVPSSSVPLDVFNVKNKSASSIVDASMQFRESFMRVSSSKPGGVQQDYLRDAAQRAYKNNKVVTIKTIKDELIKVYSENNRRPDSVNTLFNDLTQWELFTPKLDPHSFFSQSWIIDVHSATDSAQKLVVFMMLDAIYNYYRSLPDSLLDQNNCRALRLVLVIDEARRVLGFNQASLINLIRESRSKGVSIFLMSQSPQDYDSEEDNFLENVGLPLCFNTNSTSTRVLRSMFKQSIDLASLPPGVVVTKLSSTNEVLKVQAWKP